MTRTQVEIVIVCDAVVSTDVLGPVYCLCRSTGRSDSVEAAKVEAQRRAIDAGWCLTHTAGRDLCARHRRVELEHATGAPEQASYPQTWGVRDDGSIGPGAVADDSDEELLG